MEEVRQLSCVGSGNKLQRQKKGPWSLRERERQAKVIWGKRVGKGRVCSIDRATRSPPLEGIYLEVFGEVLKRIFISFPGVCFQGHGCY